MSIVLKDLPFQGSADQSFGKYEDKALNFMQEDLSFRPAILAAGTPYQTCDLLIITPKLLFLWHSLGKAVGTVFFRTWVLSMRTLTRCFLLILRQRATKRMEKPQNHRNIMSHRKTPWNKMMRLQMKSAAMLWGGLASLSWHNTLPSCRIYPDALGLCCEKTQLPWGPPWLAAVRASLYFLREARSWMLQRKQGERRAENKVGKRPRRGQQVV